MLFDVIFGENQRESLIILLMWLPIILLSLSVHESAHAYAAYKLGDPTARNLGRCTLNPVKHIDPFGFLSMLVIGVGWAKPVPIFARRFENPRKGMAISALAGPLSNLFLALVFGLLLGVSNIAWYYAAYVAIDETLTTVFTYVCTFFYYGVFLNVSLAIFNFIPVPPFDGSRILSLLLPPNLYFKIMKYEQYSGMIFLGIVVVLSYFNISLISWIVTPVTDGIAWLFETPAFEIFKAIWVK